jgi:hypothetical protein
MPAVVVEAECLAAVLMGGGLELSLLKSGIETITVNLQPSRGRLVRGKLYRVTIEEIEGPTS